MIKFALIGLVAGAFVAVCFYAVLYILRGRLNDVSDLSGQYGLPIFGEYRRSGSIHRNRGLDKIIARWELGKHVLDDRTVTDNISALIAERREARSVLLVSTRKEEKLVRIREALATRTEEQEIRSRGSFLKDSEAIAEAARADAVILVEEKGGSRLKDIERMAETLMISDAKVIGAIVL